MTGRKVEEADVVVVGAGAAGAAVGLRLAQGGARVVCLEQGGWIDRDQLPKRFADWERRGRGYWHTDPTVRRWRDDYSVRSVGETPVSPMLYMAVGGSTVGFGGVYWRLLPSDFRTHSLDGFGVDWPITYDDLASYYDENEQIIGLSGLSGDPTSPDRADPPLPPVEMGRIGEIWINAFEKLGWYWWPQDCAISTRNYGHGRGECLGRGYCRFGCPSGALATVDVSYWHRTLEAGVDLRTNARVRAISVHPNRKEVESVVYYDGDGTLRELRPKILILSCGGIGTPRLLLMSSCPSWPNGLANSSGMVGRNLMLHVYGSVIGRFDESVDGDHGAWGGSVSSREFYETDTRNGYLRGFTLGARRGPPPMETAMQTAPWGSGHHAEFERRVNREGVIAICGDDEPEMKNAVQLDWEHRDRFGLPGAIIRYELSENSLALGAAALERGRELCLAAGAKDVRDTGLWPVAGWHLMGTVRMGDDPSTSVVSADHQSHDIANLFVVDGSSMPTGGSVNPTNTIQAMALRAGDRLLTRRAEFGI